MNNGANAFNFQPTNTNNTPAANIRPSQPGGGIIPDVNFGAIWDKVVNGNQAADILPYANFQSGAKPAAPITGSPALNDQIPNGAYSTNGIASAPKAPDLSQYDSAIGTYNNAIDRLPGQLGIAQGNINTQFNQNLNQLDSTKNQSQASYKNSSTQNGQQLQSNKNTINDQASSGLRGLMRTLGAYGASGSSDALYVAPQAVAQQASSQLAGAGSNFAQNQSGLDTNWNNFLSGDADSRLKLNDWQGEQLRNAQASSATTKQNLLIALGGLKGQRSAAAGGSYTASAQPYIDQAQGLNSTIDNLAKLNPTYTGTTPTYTAAPLNNYVSQATGTKVNATPTDGSISPVLSQLLGLNKDKNNTGNY